MKQAWFSILSFHSGILGHADFADNVIIKNRTTRDCYGGFLKNWICFFPKKTTTFKLEPIQITYDFSIPYPLV